MENIAIEFKNISKSFPGVKALSNISFKVASGTVHAIVGETGAAEAAFLGNILTQLYALGEVADENEMREIVSNSCPTNYYEPKASCEMWDEAYHNYLDTIAKFKGIH